MRKLLISVAIGSLLVGCGGGGGNPALSAIGTPPPVVSVANPTCETKSNYVPLGEYLLENNQWNAKLMPVGAPFTQCVGGSLTDKGIVYTAAWDWLDGGSIDKGNVKAYPEIIYGWKPGFQQSTTKQLPRVVDNISEIYASISGAASVINGPEEMSGNSAIDIWLTSTPTPRTFSVPTISHEIMIWDQDKMGNGGNFVTKTTIDGIEYSFYVGYNFGRGWTYLAFIPESKVAQPKKDINIRKFMDYLKTNKHITGAEWLASVEYGNEIVSGTGSTYLSNYSVTVK